MSFAPATLTIDSRLRYELRRLVRRMQARRLHQHSAGAWLGGTASASAVAVICVFANLPAVATFAAVAVVFVITGWLVSRWWRLEPLDFAAAAALIERVHPELRQSLRTALEQRPDASGRYTYLQERVIREALEHATKHFWSRAPVAGARRAALGHLAAFIACCLVLAFAPHLARSLGGRAASPRAGAGVTGLEIIPGNAEVERGSTVVITARFGQKLPRNAVLHRRTADGSTHTEPMERSLADPVFAATLPYVSQDFDYTVVHDENRSTTFQIRVFDLPAMLRGDAALEYPAYTGLEPRTIEDTRRISAVEGSQLDYTVLTNKPVRDARLRTADGAEVALTPANPERTRFVAAMPVEKSLRYTLHLEDDAGRANRLPPEIRIEALPNRRPDLKFAFPRGDQRVSPLEEVTLEAKAADDFGLLDYGIAWSVADAEPEYLSLRPVADPAATTTPPRSAGFSHLIALETHGAQPDQLVTWFAWADDMGSDGKPRRTAGDLFFGEVRPFDEIFREGEGQNPQAGAAGAGGQEAADLLEMQRDISVAIWKLRDRAPQADAFHEDVGTVLEAQGEVRGRLRELGGQLTEARLQEAATAADGHMDQAEDRLDESREHSTVEPLSAAWTSSQGAYQALLRLQPRTTEVGRQNASQRGQGGGRGNQRQLDQLRFKDEQDRYETESQAQLTNTPEQREQMQTLARLRELARRQGDLNERLQQLQTALEAEEDEAAREEIERELKRLEEEQRRMIADLDELRQRMDNQTPGSESAEAREQVERTREDMRRASDALEEGAVSRALASGTRARENLEEARETMREESASEFADEMRDARRAARDLAEAQQRTEEQIAREQQDRAPSLDSAPQRDDLARAVDENRESLDALNEQLRRVTEDAEEAEPGLHRQLYDMMREQGQGGGAEDRMRASAELLRRGLVDQARQLQPDITESVQELARGVERAAESVLGDEAETLRFAQAELDELARELGSGEREGEGENDGETGDSPPSPGDSGSPTDPQAVARTDGQRQPGAAESGSESGSGEGQDAQGERRGEAGSRGGGDGGGSDELTRALEAFAPGNTARGGGSGGWGDDRDSPITEGDFGGWEERLRTVEALLDQPDARERLAGARELAAELRREYRRHGKPPQWGTVESGIVAPLAEVRTWLRQELARREDPATLQPVDRDPVPEAYAESVQKYYEALGAP